MPLLDVAPVLLAEAATSRSSLLSDVQEPDEPPSTSTWLAPLPAAFTLTRARELGTPARALYALRDAGLIEALGRGLYARRRDPADLTLLAAAIRAPRATMCLRSALARHG